MTLARWTAIMLLAAQAAWAQTNVPLPPAPASSAPLPAGGAAGVSQAQQVNSGLLLTGAAALIAGLALVAVSGGGGHNTVKPQSESITATTTTP